MQYKLFLSRSVFDSFVPVEAKFRAGILAIVIESEKLNNRKTTDREENNEGQFAPFNQV